MMDVISAKAAHISLLFTPQNRALAARLLASKVN